MSSPTTSRRPGELTARELLRFGWRQLTSMRTALILLLLLALAAIPGSIIPQEGVDALAAGNWKEQHPDLTPIYERLGLFDVYGSVWFAAVYILLMVSLVGCIVPRVGVYWRGLRAQPPAVPSRLARMPDAAAYSTDEAPDAVVARAEALLRSQRYRLREAVGRAEGSAEGSAEVSAEKGYLREAGNLLFHLSVLVVLVGFAMGSLLGYKGGVIVVVGEEWGFTNTPSQYDDLVPGSLFAADEMDDFLLKIRDFDVEWLESGPRQGMAQGFVSHIDYCVDCADDADPGFTSYDLKVNHPLTIGDTDIFLIGHGYAPVVTVRDGEGEVTYSGPTVFLPLDQSFFSFGVVKAPYAQPEGIGLQGWFYPTFLNVDGNPITVMGDARNPLLSFNVYRGDLNVAAGPQSVYELDTSKAEQLTREDGQPLRLDLTPGETAELPDGLGSVTFEGVERWNKIQISQTPGKLVALAGVVLALLGLLGSLFVRPRRVWVRARREGESTLVEVAALDRSGGGDTAAVVATLVSDLQQQEKK